MPQNALPIDSVFWESVIDYDPLIVIPETRLTDVVELMGQTEWVDSHYPDCVLVVSDRQPVGILTSHDIVRLVASRINLAETTIADVMSQPAVLLNVADCQDIATLATVLQQQPVRHLPIVNEQNHLVGLVTMERLQPYLCKTLEQLHYQFAEEKTAELRRVNQQLQQEVAERKQIEQGLKESQTCLRLINSISTRITSGMSVKQLIEATVQQLSQYFDTLRVAYFTLNDQGMASAVCSVDPSTMPPIGINTNMAMASEFLRALRQLQPVIIEDICQSEMAAPLVDALLAEGTQALLDIPLQSSKTQVSFLSFESPTPRCWSDYEIATLIEIADYLSLILQEAHAQQERQRMEAALLESQHMNSLLATALEHAGDAIEVTTPDNTIQYVNPAWETITGYSRFEAIGKTSAALLASSKHTETFYQDIDAKLSTGQVWRGNIIVKCKDNSLCYQETTISPVSNASGKIEHYVAVRRDITDRKRIEESLRLTQFSLDHAVDAAFWIRPNGGFIYVNRSACRSLGYSYVQLLTMSMRDIMPYFPSIDWVQCWNTLKAQTSLSFESYYRTQQGTFFPVELTINYLEFKGKEYGFVFARDITKRKQVEETLRLRQQAITASASGIVITNARLPTLPIIYVNPAFERITGYSAAEVIGKSCRLLQRDDYHQAAIAELRAAIQEQRECTVTLRNYRKDGTLFWNELSIAPIFDPGGTLTHYVGIQTDISDRKRVEEEMRKANAEMSALFTAMTDLIIVFDRQGHFLKMPSVESFKNVYRPEINRIGKTLHEIFPKETADTFLNYIRTCLDTRQTVHVEYSLIMEGEEKWSDASISPIDNDTVIWVIRDTTTRKQAADQLKASLDEKELLLKEVHHRVKNNLQVISSIFSLQAHHIKDEDTLALLTESQNRIRSMALIHEKLYQSDSLARVDFGSYIQNLVSNLFSSYQISSHLIRLTLDVSNISLNIDTAIPCGLLLNELVSNSLKHGFPDHQAGEIKIYFTIDEENQVYLIVRDSGIGLPEPWDIQQINSLGLRLVRALVRQLNGKLDMHNDHGAVFQIVFPQPMERRRI